MNKYHRLVHYIASNYHYTFWNVYLQLTFPYRAHVHTCALDEDRREGIHFTDNTCWNKIKGIDIYVIEMPLSYSKAGVDNFFRSKSQQAKKFRCHSFFTLNIYSATTWHPGLVLLCTLFQLRSLYNPVINLISLF
jgi:hypothetical protein